MEAGGVGEVLASNDPGFKPGDMVLGMTGWTTHVCLPAKTLRKLPPELPPSLALGVLGMPGFTGWYGLNTIGQPKSGENLVVAAATGPVGSMVGQLAKAAGLRTVGIAGGADKCALATKTFGFDACLDHRAHTDASSLRQALAAEVPDGIDIYFENVGGKVLEAVVPLMNPHGRIPLCGTIAWYNDATEGGLTLPQFWRATLVKFLHVQGFIIMNHWDRLPEFLGEVAPKVASGDVAYLEDVANGLEAAPNAPSSVFLKDATKANRWSGWFETRRARPRSAPNHAPTAKGPGSGALQTPCFNPRQLDKPFHIWLVPVFSSNRRV